MNKQMNKIGDIKKVKKFAFFPTKIGNKYIWLKYYIDVYKYQQLKGKRLLPVENIVREDGKLVYDERFSKTEIYTYEKWVRIKSVGIHNN